MTGSADPSMPHPAHPAHPADLSIRDTPKPISPSLIAVAGWAVPGLGHILLGQRARGVVIMVTILMLYAAGLLIADIRVIDVPGFDKNGFEERVDSRGVKAELGSIGYAQGTWIMFSSNVLSEIIAKPWYVGQFLVGPINLISSLVSIHEASMNVPMSHAHIAEIGTLYTAVAGMLNLLAIIDAASRASNDQQAFDGVEEPA